MKINSFTQKANLSVLTIILLLIAWGFLSFRIGSPWLGHQDANGAWISTTLRNYERYGFLNLSGLVTFNTTPQLLAEIPDYYIRHPPLAVWISYPLVATSGFHEALVRVIYAGCTLISAAALATLAKRLFKSGGIWALSLYLFTPMMLYFGRMPDHEAPALMFCILLAVVLVDWIRHPTQKRFAVAATLMVALSWTAWGGLIVGVSLCGMLLLTYRQRWRGLLALIVIGMISALAVILYYQLIWSGAIDELINFFIWRTSNVSGSPDTVPFTISEYIVRILLRFLTLYTITVLVLAILGLWQIRRVPRITFAIISGFLVGAFAFILVFRNASYIHDYYLIYFAPGLALLGTGAILWSQKTHRFHRWLRPTIAAFILLWPIITIVTLSQLYAGSTSDEPLRFAASLKAYTNMEDTIVSNLPNYGMSTEFYAEREIIWDTMPEKVADLRSSNRRLYYLYCGERDDLDAIEPDEVIDVFTPCWLASFD